MQGLTLEAIFCMLLPLLILITVIVAIVFPLNYYTKKSIKRYKELESEYFRQQAIEHAKQLKAQRGIKRSLKEEFES